MFEIKEAELSPYRLAKIASELCGRYVREQMVYQYVRLGMIVARKNDLGKWTIARKDAEAWLSKYVPKNGVKPIVVVDES